MSTSVRDFAGLKADFPILGTELNGKPLVYLDSAATAQKPAVVLEAMDAYYRETNANVHRGVYGLAAEATDRYEYGRSAVARLISHPSEGVVFTKNASEAINLVAWAWGIRNLKPGDEILITEMEHHSNIVPWQLVAQIVGATVRFAPITDEGELDLDAMRKMISGKTKMVACVHISNVLGTINPVAEVAALAHEHGALCLVDGAQSVPQMPIRFDDLGCDFLAFTGHKLGGPTGIGVLAGKLDVLNGMEPFLGGGHMIKDVTTAGSTFAASPGRFEAGTPPIAEGVGLGAAVDYVMGVGLERIRAHEIELAGALLDGVGSIPGVTIHGPKDPTKRAALVSFVVPDVHPHDMAQLLDQEGVCVRAGHHCTKPLMKRLGVNATTRASCYVYNGAADVEPLVRGIDDARRYLAA